MCQASSAAHPDVSATIELSVEAREHGRELPSDFALLVSDSPLSFCFPRLVRDLRCYEFAKYNIVASLFCLLQVSLLEERVSLLPRGAAVPRLLRRDKGERSR